MSDYARYIMFIPTIVAVVMIVAIVASLQGLNVITLQTNCFSTQSYECMIINSTTIAFFVTVVVLIVYLVYRIIV